MDHRELVALAAQMMRHNPEYLADAARGAPVGNSVVGSLISLLHGVPRQYAEPAVFEAARALRKPQRRKGD